MNVCMYACMHACMHVCMHVCLHVCVHLCIHVCMFVCVFVCMHACMHACMYVYVYVGMYVHERKCTKLTRTQHACSGSRAINIGMDETYDLGEGVSRSQVQRHGKYVSLI